MRQGAKLSSITLAITAVSRQPLHLKDLIKLNFFKNQEGQVGNYKLVISHRGTYLHVEKGFEVKQKICPTIMNSMTLQYQCPVMEKVFTEHTHIVAVKPTGNVYCWEAVEELNIKAKDWKDLLTSEPLWVKFDYYRITFKIFACSCTYLFSLVIIEQVHNYFSAFGQNGQAILRFAHSCLLPPDRCSTRKDIIHIQDPLNMQQRSIEAFDHVKKDLRVDDEDEEGEGSGTLRNTTEDMKRVLGALQTQEAKVRIHEDQSRLFASNVYKYKARCKYDDTSTFI